MIKRYILHIELHRRYRPRISFKRAPRPGDRVVDGGMSGTLVRCPTCEEGFLHKPDPLPRFPRPKPLSKPPLLSLFIADLVKNLNRPASRPVRPVRSYHESRLAMDWNTPTHVELKSTKEKLETPVVELKFEEPAEHVELKLGKPPEHVELKLENESPKTLELDYTLGNNKYELGDIVWTHKAEYVVRSLTKNKLSLVRKDVWDAREKKATHVEVETKDEKPVEIVELKFE